MIAIPIASLHPIAGVGSILGTLNALSVNPIGGAVHGERLPRLQIVNPRATRIVVLRIHVSVAIGEPPRPYGRGFCAFRRDDCFRHGYMTSYEVTPRFRGLLHAHVVLPVGKLAWPGDI